MDRFNNELAEANHADDRDQLERLAQFRSDLASYCKACAFLSQIVDYEDTMLEKRYLFYRTLA